jgi:hypothetical protein
MGVQCVSSTPGEALHLARVVTACIPTGPGVVTTPVQWILRREVWATAAAPGELLGSCPQHFRGRSLQTMAQPVGEQAYHSFILPCLRSQIVQSQRYVFRGGSPRAGGAR